MQVNDESSLSEFLNDEKNQRVVLFQIMIALRGRGEWGRHGLFAALAKELDFSAAYIGRVLTGKNPIRENFARSMSGYLGVSIYWLCGAGDRSYEEEVIYWEEYEKKVRKTDTNAIELEESQSLETGYNLIGPNHDDIRKEITRQLRSKQDVSKAGRENLDNLSKQGREKYPELWAAFLAIPGKERGEALSLLKKYHTSSLKTQLISASMSVLDDAHRK